MLTYDNKEFRNLVEQVQYLSDLHEAGKALASWGIKIVGQLESISELPVPYTGEYGDAYAVGTEAPFNFYIWTRASIAGGEAYWFPFGKISIVGPQGPAGPKGDKGDPGQTTTWYTGSTYPPSPKEDDLYLAPDGYVYKYKSPAWIPLLSITGPQGIQGIQGPVGPIGPVGPVGDIGPRGPAGTSVVIQGILQNVNQLPLPSQLSRTDAYLVGETEPYLLYIQIEENEQLVWKPVGSFYDYANIATLNILNGEGLYSLVQKQGTGGTSGGSGLSDPSVATGLNATALGVRCKGTGDCTFVAGYGATGLNKGSVAFGNGRSGRTEAEWIAYFYDANTLEAKNGGSLQLIDPQTPTPSGKGIIYKNGQQYYVLNSRGNRYGQFEFNPSFAEGQSTKALGFNTHAQGYSTTAEGDFSDTSGQSTKTVATHSHAGGYSTTNNSKYGFVHGLYLNTNANITAQTGFGKYNKATDALFFVGKGTSSSARANAFEVLNDGIKIGNTTITETQLQQLLNML